MVRPTSGPPGERGRRDDVLHVRARPLGPGVARAVAWVLIWWGLPMAAPLTSVAAQAAATGQVVGRVTNVTAGAGPSDGLTVTLRAFRADAEEPSRTAAVAADGGFRFAGLPVDENTAYVTQTEYQGVIYYSSPGVIAAEGQSLDLGITVAETGTDASALRVSRLSIVIVGQAADRIQVAESYRVANDGDRTVVASTAMGAAGVTWHLPLPPGAESVTFMSGSPSDGVRIQNGGVDVSLPIRPGEDALQLRFAYTLPYDGGLELSRQPVLPVDEVVLAAPVSSGPVISGDGVSATGEMDTQMGTARSYLHGPLAAGATLTLVLSGPVQAAATTSTAAEQQPEAQAVARKLPAARRP